MLDRLSTFSWSCLRSVCNHASPCLEARSAAERAAVHVALLHAALQHVSITPTTPLPAFAATAHVSITPTMPLPAFAATAVAPPAPVVSRSSGPTPPVGTGCQVANCVGCRGAPTNCYLCKPVSPRRCPQL